MGCLYRSTRQPWHRSRGVLTFSEVLRSCPGFVHPINIDRLREKRKRPQSTDALHDNDREVVATFFWPKRFFERRDERFIRGNVVSVLPKNRRFSHRVALLCRSTVTPPPQLLFSEIAGFETTSRLHLLKIGSPCHPDAKDVRGRSTLVALSLQGYLETKYTSFQSV